MSTDVVTESKGKKWCTKAWELLKAGKINGQTEQTENLKKALGGVLSGLKQLKGVNEEKYNELNGEFLELAKLGKLATTTKAGDRDLALTLSAQLEHLNVRVQYALGGQSSPNITTKGQSVEKLSNTVTELYLKKLEKAKQSEMALAQRNEGKHKFNVEVSQLISRAESLVQDTRQDLLRDHSHTDAMVVLSEVEATSQLALQRHKKFLDYKQAHAEAKKRSEELKMLDPGSSVGVDKVIENAEKQALTFDYAAAVETLKTVDGLYKQVLKSEKVSEHQVNYLKAFVDAKEKSSHLTTYNHDSTDYAGTIKEKMSLAEGLTKPPKADFKQALAELKGVPDDYAQQLKLAQQERTNRTNAARHKPIYDDKVFRIQEAIKELEQLPGTTVAVGKLNALLKAGEKELQESHDYQRAYKALEGLSDTYKLGLEAAASFGKTAGDELYRSNLTLAQEQLRRLDELVGTSQPALIAQHQQAINNSLMRLSKKPTDVQVETLTIGTLAGNLKKSANEYENLKELCQGKKDSVATKMTELLKLHVLAHSELLRLQSSADIDFSIDDFEKAQKQYETIEEKITELKLGDLFKSATAWETMHKKLQTEKHLDVLMLTRESTIPALQGYGPLRVEIEQAILKLDKATNDEDLIQLFKDAIAVAEKVIKASADITKATNSYNEFDQQRKKAKSTAEELIKKANEKLASLLESNAKTSDLQSRLEQLKQEWYRTIAASLTEEEIRQALSDFTDKLNTEITEKVDDILNDPAELKKLQEEFKKDQASEESAKSQKELDAKLKALATTISDMRRDSESYDFLGPVIRTSAIEFPILDNADLKLAEIKNNSTKSVEDRKSECEQFKKDLDLILQNYETERGTLRGNALADVEKCRQKLTELTSPKERKKFKPFFAAITDRVDDLVAMADSSVCSTVERAGFMAKTIMTEELEPMAAAFGQFDEQLKAIRLNLNDKDLVSFFAEKRKTFQWRLDNEILIKAHNSGPVGAKKQIEDFLVELRRAVDESKRAKVAKEEIKLLVADCKEKCSKLSDAPHLLKRFKGMIKGASSVAEGGETKAIQQLKSVQTQIESVLSSSSPDLIVEMERSARENEVQGELKLEQFKATLELFDKTTMGNVNGKVKEVGKSDVNKDLLEEIKSLREQVGKMFKQGLLDAALDKLDTARTRADDFMRNPFSIKVTSRKNLSAVATRWRQAVVEFVKGMKELQQTVQKGMEEENKTTPGKFNVDSIVTPLNDATRSFDAQRFDGFITTINEQLSPKKLTLDNVKAYRQAKEEALRFVRHYQKVLAEDPVLQKVTNNPFSVEVALPEIRDALRDLEVNLRRA